AYQPIRKSSSIYDPQAAPIRDLAFDAALLRVDPVDLKTRENRLGPNLPLAPESKLLALGPGSPIAVIGYPYDTLDSGLTPDAAISRAERGVVSAMIAPLDSAAEVENPGLANLVIHRLSTAGGSSGSPLINADGEVVGLHTHGVESTSSNGDSAAQRADVLHDLLSDTREKERVATIFVPAWKHTLTYWARAADVLPWSFYKEYAVPGEKPAPSVGSIDYAAKAPFDRTVSKAEFGGAVDDFKVAAEDLAAKDSKSARFVIREAGEYAAMWVKVDRARDAVLFAYDYSMRQRNAACRLTTYWRKRGDSRLAVARARASFEQFFPALPEGGVEEYQIVHRRDVGCDPTNKAFFTGSIAWGSAPEATLVSAQGGQSGAILRMAQAAHSTINKAISCTFQPGDDESCAAPEYVSLDARALDNDRDVTVGSAPQENR
ncbi:MAG: serine protease, partial [Parvularculaceae bacterium]|nr:serine protease [Parvularculaceae bacterium]